MKKTLQQRIDAAVREEIRVVDYDPAWPGQFAEEAAFLRARLPESLLKRIEHFGSTAVPGLAAKPVVDILVEVRSLQEARAIIVPLLEADGYEYFWRPEFEGPPYYAWFIKRDPSGKRTHHIHMVERDSSLWDRLYFRDYLRAFPEEAERYAALKRALAGQFPQDRVGYTRQKSGYINSVTLKAKGYYSAPHKAAEKNNGQGH
jgi:GrpB-like predicted nucleotidyltransferase (UPF0157 family)